MICRPGVVWVVVVVVFLVVEGCRRADVQCLSVVSAVLNDDVKWNGEDGAKKTVVCEGR